MIKRALISGLPSAGNNVLDLGNVPIPVARHYTRASPAVGGLHVRLSPYDQRVVDIRFIDGTGQDLTREQERAVERIFFREDYRRAYMEDIGTIEYAKDMVELYSQDYLKALDLQAIRQRHFKIVVDYAHAPAAEVLPRLLEELNVEVVPLNARIDPNRLSPSQAEFHAERHQLAAITGVLRGVSLGARLDVGGEKLFVVDETGTSISEPRMCAAMVALVFRTYPGSTVVVTADQSQVFEHLAERYGGYVRRCPVDVQALMESASEGTIAVAADGAGSFAFPAIHPGIDGLMALGKLLELLALQNVPLSQVIAELPPFHVASGAVECSWETKGRVMRCVMEHFAKFRHDTLDGIKVLLDGDAWVLIRPDADTAMFHIVAEAKSLPAAQELVADYGGFVRGFVQAPPEPVSSLSAEAETP